MPRPRLPDEQKTRPISISLDPRILAIADRAKVNRSRFFNTTAECYGAIVKVAPRHRDKEISDDEALGRIEEISTRFKALFPLNYEEKDVEEIPPVSRKSTHKRQARRDEDKSDR